MFFNRILDKLPVKTFSVLAGIIIGLVVLGGINNSLKNNRNHIYSDAEGYFIYLPAWFIHQNFKDLDIRAKRQFKIQENTGNYFTKYSMGVALAELPVFLITDIFHRKLLKESLKGSEVEYSRAIAISAWLAFVIGMMALMKWMSRSHRLYDVFISVIMIAFGTNLWYYTTMEPGASHVYSFALFAVSGNLIDYCYRKNQMTWPTAMLIGFLFSWIILTRPTNIVYLIFLLCYFPSGQFNVQERLTFLVNNWVKLMPFVVFSSIMWFAQLYQWDVMRGVEEAYSYKGEGFIYWKNPKVLRVLLDVQNGLLIYSPVIWISLYGLFRFFNEKAATSRLILAVFLFMTLIFGSWWAWWFGGAYGHRCYVEFYVILLIPLLWVVQQINSSREILSKILFYVLACFMLYYSLGLTYLYRGPWDGPNWNWDRFSDIVRSLF